MRLLPCLDSHAGALCKQRAALRIAIAIFSSAWVFGWGQSLLADENAGAEDQASQSKQVQTRKMTIHPKAESKPSLKIHLLPAASEQLDGNAALFYLKATGFFEQDNARIKIREMMKKGAEQAKLAGKEGGMDYPPYSYLGIHPRDYPKTEVRDYLQLLSFQEPWLREARRHRNFSMDRNIQLSDNPMGYLLAEIQSFRELARNQSIRCRLAIAENRIEDAIDITGQQVTMSRHIAMDDFLVSYLVGGAVLGVALEDTMLLQEHAECPNLYWAFAQLPNPLLNTERCVAVEGEFVYLQIPKLKEIDTVPKSPAYWTEFLADFAKQTSDIDRYNEQEETAVVSKVQGERRVESIQEAIHANVPQAKKYLLDRRILTLEEMNTYPEEQLVFLAMREHYEVFRDDYFKWLHAPYRVAIEGMKAANLQLKSQREREEFGWFTGISFSLLPTIEPFYTAVTRARQQIAVVQAIEAIRMAGAENGGKLIASLDQAPVPVPNDPFTDKPFDYFLDGEVAVLSSVFPIHAPIRVEVKFHKVDE